MSLSVPRCLRRASAFEVRDPPSPRRASHHHHHHRDGTSDLLLPVPSSAPAPTLRQSSGIKINS